MEISIFCECEHVCKNLSTVNDNRKTVDRLLSKLSVNCQRQQAPLKGCACSCQFQLTTTTTPALVVGPSCGCWLCRTLAWSRYAVDIFCNGGYIPILRGIVWRGRAGRANADGSRACMRRTPPKSQRWPRHADGLPSDAQKTPSTPSQAIGRAFSRPKSADSAGRRSRASGAAWPLGRVAASRAGMGVAEYVVGRPVGGGLDGLTGDLRS